MGEHNPSDAALPKWTWHAVGTPPPPRKPVSIKVKALIQAPIMAVVGYVIYRVWGHLVGPVIVWTLAALVLVGGLFVPAIFHGFERFGMLLAKWVSAALTWGLLTPFFYLVFTFGRLVLAVQRLDPMDRKFPEPGRTTFWVPRPRVPSMEQYKKQH
jgi:hypothetical protein